MRSEITYLFWLSNVFCFFCPEESLYKLETTAKHIIQNAIKYTNQSAVKHTTHTAVKHDPYCTKIHHHTAVAYTTCSAMLQAIQKARDHDIPKDTAIMIFGRFLCVLVLFCLGFKQNILQFLLGYSQFRWLRFPSYPRCIHMFRWPLTTATRPF